jgi:RHS repeat-associated protein
LNIVFFDEQFKFVQTGSQLIPANVEGTAQHIVSTGTQVPKNGYVYIFVSNESNDLVYFDNLQVTHLKGPILEETHYYPFGLTMAGISDKAAGGLENKYKWNKGSELQNKEFSDGSGLELYATNLRSLDPQLGRWWQIDSKPDYTQSLYSAMGNNPILHNDPLGDTLVFPGASNKFIQISATTIGNIVNKGAGKALGELLTSTENIKVVELKGKGVSNYNSKTKTLSWNPKLGIVTTNGTKLSPASVLNHEADHASDAIKDPAGHAARASTPDANYGNAEEKRVIQGTEQTTSVLLGETKQGQVTRTDHSANAIIITNDPMSTDGKVINLSGTPETLAPVTINMKPKSNNE